MIIRLCLSILITLTLSADTIELKEAKTNQKRISPNSTEHICSYHLVLEKATPSIVHISTTQTSQNLQMQEYLNDFFGQRRALPPSSKKRRGLGSGVILSKDGYIVTNNHVIDKADDITVTLPVTAKTYKAKLIGTDPKSDIALIKIDTKDTLEPIFLGDSSQLKVGDLVFAIGNPFGVGQSVTQGIISAQHKNGIGINEYENFIQTDASINPGNSGGALVDSRGALIGINTAILSRSGGNNGIGFAIEVNMVKDVVQKLLKDGKVDRGYLGVQISDLTPKLFDLYSKKKGALIIDVSKNTPADMAGLKRGDLIIKVNNRDISNAAELKNSIGMIKPQSQIKVSYERDKKIYTAELTLQSQEQQLHLEENVLGGLNLSNLDNNIRYRYRIPNDIKGVLITEVQEDGQAFEQGVQEGDIIIQVEAFSISSLEDVKKAINSYKNSFKRVYIRRNSHIYIAALK